jgi:hypothetical protein
LGIGKWRDSYGERNGRNEKNGQVKEETVVGRIKRHEWERKRNTWGKTKRNRMRSRYRRMRKEIS